MVELVHFRITLLYPYGVQENGKGRKAIHSLCIFFILNAMCYLYRCICVKGADLTTTIYYTDISIYNLTRGFVKQLYYNRLIVLTR